MIKIVNKFFLCLLLVFGLFQQQQSSAQVIFDDLKIGIDKVESDEVVFNSLQEIGVYYKNNQFEKGLEIASNLFQGQFNQSAIQSNGGQCSCFTKSIKGNKSQSKSSDRVG